MTGGWVEGPWLLKDERKWKATKKDLSNDNYRKV
jgi:hypothetical protein